MSSRAQSVNPFMTQIVAVVASLMALALMAAPVRADEVYFCEGGRMVTVRFGDLEKLASSDPCIAEHVARRARASGVEALAPQKPADIVAGRQVEVVPPLPERKPAYAAALPTNGEVIVHHEAPPSGTANIAETAGADEALVARVTPIVFRHARRVLLPAYAGAPSRKQNADIDFRNVPIINAAPGEPGIFHHAR